MAVLAFLAAHIGQIAGALFALVSLASIVVGFLPLSASKRSAIVGVLARISALQHSSLKLPFSVHPDGKADVDVPALLADLALIEAAFNRAKDASASPSPAKQVRLELISAAQRDGAPEWRFRDHHGRAVTLCGAAAFRRITTEHVSANDPKRPLATRARYFTDADDVIVARGSTIQF